MALTTIKMLKVERAKVEKLEGELASMNAHFEILRDQKLENKQNDKVKHYEWLLEVQKKHYENQRAWRDIHIKKLEHNLEEI